MLCFLLINFIEDIEIDGMLVDHFQKRASRPLRNFDIKKLSQDLVS